MDEPATPFAEAAAYYDGFRPPYAPAALDHVAATLGLDSRARILDLGCGPGTLAIPLSRRVAEVVAVDPEPAMLAEGARLASAQGRANIRWVLARAEDLDPAATGRFRAAVLGQSLHWMDRDRILARLADLIEDGGGLAILDEGQDHAPESWAPTAFALAAAYVGRRPRHPGKHPEVAHEPSLRRSAAFAGFTVREFPIEITRDVAAVIGCVYSSINATRAMFGDRAPAFEAELTAALLRQNPSGVFHERLATAVFVAPKG